MSGDTYRAATLGPEKLAGILTGDHETVLALGLCAMSDRIRRAIELLRARTEKPPVASAVELVAERLHNEWCDGMKQVPEWQKVKDAIGGETIWHEQARELLSALARVDPDTCAVLRAAWALCNNTEGGSRPARGREVERLSEALTDWECEHGDIYGPHGWNLPAKDDEGAEPDSWSFDPPDRVEATDGR